MPVIQLASNSVKGAAVAGDVPRSRPSARGWHPFTDRLEPSSSLVQLAFVVLLGVDLVTTSFIGGGRLLMPEIVAAIVLVVAVLVATGALPWARFPHAAVAVLPVLDLVALGLTRIGLPGTGADILCVIPALWLAREFGFRGAIGAGVAVVATMSVPWMVVLGPVQGNVSSALLAPASATLMGALLAWATRQVRRSDDEAESQRRLNTAILDTVDVGLVLLDRHGAYQSMNRHHAQLMPIAYPDGHAGQAGQIGLVYDEDGQHLLSREEMPTRRATLGEEFDDCRIWIGDDPLTWRALSVSARTVRDEDGGFAGAALAYKDVTEFMRALKVKDEFVASVSHELRTPLTSIRGYADLLMERQDLPDQAVAQLSVLIRNSERLGRLVADLLHSAQVDLGPMHVVRTSGDLAQIVRDALAAAAPAAAASGVAIAYDGPEELGMMMDHGRMRQVVDNLVSNAIKYTPPEGDVAVRIAVDGSRIELEVADSGIGIDAADRDRLFTRFFRAQQAEEQNIQGVGLGLSITKSIVESHGGRIEVDSEPGHGTTFRARLPVDGY